MNADTKSITTFIDEQVLAEHASADIGELVDHLPEDSEDAAREFCEALSLGDWFYDAITLNNIDINEALINIAEQRRREEVEAMDERMAAAQDLRNERGWRA